MRKLLIFLLVAVAGYLRELLSYSSRSYQILFAPGFERARWQIGRWKA